MKYIIQLYLLFFTFNISYGQEFETYTIKIEDGKKIIENKAPLWKYQKVALFYYRQIGEVEGTDENYQFFYPIQVAIDSKDNLYVVEAGSIRIQKFDKDLNYIKTIGRRGQGSGEFMTIRGIVIQRDTLYVESASTLNSTISVLTLDGKEIRRIRIPTITLGFYITRKGVIISNSNRDKTNYLERNNRILEGKYLALYDNNGVLLKEFGDYFDYGNNEANNKNSTWEFVYDENDFLYVYFWYHNRIEKYSPGGEFIFRATWPFDYKIPIPYKSSGQYNIRGGGIDHKNRVWIRMVNRLLHVSEVKPEDMSFAVFNKDGVLLGFVPVPRKDRVQIIGDSVIFINRGDTREDTHCIYEYKIID